jgi:hypothetical protein
LTSHQVNWSTKLQDFDFLIHHIRGSMNGWADALSRLVEVESDLKPQVQVLLDSLFISVLLQGDEEPEKEKKEYMDERKAELIALDHDLPTAGHPGV